MYNEQPDFDLNFNTNKPQPGNLAEPRRHAASGHGHIPEAELREAAARLKRSKDQWATAMEYAEQHVPSTDDHALMATIQHDIAVSLLARVGMQTGFHLKVYYGWEMMDEDTVVTVGEQGWVTQSAVTIDSHSVGLVMAPSTNFEKTGQAQSPLSVISYSKIWKAEINWNYRIPDPRIKTARS